MTPHLFKIKKHFLKLKEIHDWIKRHINEPEAIQGVLDRSKRIVDALEELGVTRQFSGCLIIFGPVITDFLVNQFESED